MSISTEAGSGSSLYCELCDYVQFSSYTDFHIHHLIHIRQPLIRLVKLNSNLFEKLKTKSYTLKTGVARRSCQPGHVPPLKISLVKQQGDKHFHVIKKKDFKVSSGSSSPNLEDQFSDVNSTCEGEGSSSKGFSGGNSGVLEVEGKNLLKRFGAQISVSGKAQPTTPSLSGNGNGNGKNEPEYSVPSTEVKKENILERLSGIEGISISTRPKLSTNGNSELKVPPGISISTKQKSLDLNQLKKLKDQDNENDKKHFDKNKILEKLSGSGFISIAPKLQTKSESGTEEDKVDPVSEVKPKEDFKQGSPKSKSVEASERTDSEALVTSNKGNIDLNNGGSSTKNSGGQTCQMNTSEEGNVKTVNDNSLEGSEQKKFVRVKNSTFSKKNIRLERQKSQEEPLEDRTVTPEDLKEGEGRERGIDILERLTDSLNNAVGSEKSRESSSTFSTSGSGDSNQGERNLEMQKSLASDSEGEHHLDLNITQSDQVNSVTSEFSMNQENLQEPEQNCSLLMGPSNSNDQEEEPSDFNAINPSENYSGPDSVSEENNDIVENPVSFSSLTTEDPSQDPNNQASSFWPDLSNTSDHSDQPQQDPLMTPENAVPNGEGISQNFLHNFLGDPQPPPNSIPPENSEFMSLDRLAQTQHQQSSYDMNNGDSNTPMEQLSQQVQRIPNQTPQINVVPQHHMQAPQPPQLHTGLPLSPQHISPQQPNSYALGHMQPPMPPPLYPGFNMFNQNFPPQTQQQIPRPPLMQQRPHLQPRSFESLAAPQRQRIRPLKRNSIRLPGTHDMGPPKQRRMDPPLQTRPQMQNPTNPTAKLPSGITVTPPKKTLEANKVANVLASRGITVTPAASRPTNNAARVATQQRNPTPTQPPILNISSAISITSNRGNGGFAVPGPRRNAPIVNHNVERPERCTTVDLTQDDDIVHLPKNRASLGRLPCNQCGKVFTSSVALENHKASHRAAATLPYKCDKCTAQYTSAAHLQQHKLTSHKSKQSAPDLAIPIVDLNHPGAREQLLKCGVYNFIPLAQLQSNNNGYFGVPIIQLDTAKQKAVSNLSILGAGNILVLGKMKALAPQPNH